jgi:hypothetical protein
MVTKIVVRMRFSLGSSPFASTSRTANTIEASPRGPNQPRKASVGGLALVPAMATATGAMRTSVRLRTAYAATAHVRCSSDGPSSVPPKTTNVAAPSSPPSSSSR